MAERNPRIAHSIESLLFVNRNGKYCGYKQELISENISADLREFLICAECEGISRKPRNWGGYTFCEMCVPEEHRKIGDIDERVENKVTFLNARCPLSEECCGWEGKLWEIQQHMEECLGMRVEYQLECGISIERGTYEQHNREVRKHKMKSCDYCNQKVHANEENRHRGKCQYHPDTEIPCPYKELGCEAIALRKNINTHLTENMTSHKKLMQSQIKQRNQLKDKKEQLERTNQHQKNRNEELEKSNQHKKNMIEELEKVNEQQKNTNEQQKNKNEKLERVNEQQKNKNEELERVNEQQENRNEGQQRANEQQKNKNEEQQRVNEQQENRNEERQRVNEQQKNRNEEQQRVNEQQKNKIEELERLNQQRITTNEILATNNHQRQSNTEREGEYTNERNMVKRRWRVWALLALVVVGVRILITAIIGIAVAVTKGNNLKANANQPKTNANQPKTNSNQLETNLTQTESLLSNTNYIYEYIETRRKVLPGIEMIYDLTKTGTFYGPTLYLGQCKLRLKAEVTNYYGTTKRAIYYVERLKGEYDDTINNCRITYSHISYWYLGATQPEDTYPNYLNAELKVGHSRTIGNIYWKNTNQKGIIRAYFDTAGT